MQYRLSSRQRLINMMYLVLLALLALNIQVDFIDAFFDISKSIERTVEKIDLEHNQSMVSITRAYELDSNSYKEAYQKSVEAVVLSLKSIAVIDSLRDVLLQKTGGFNEYGYPNNSISSRVSDNVFIQRNGAKKLKDILQSSKEDFLKLLPENEVYQLRNIYETSDYIENSRGIKLSWEVYHFNNLALGGALALLSRFKNDITAMKSVILSYYLNDIYGELTELIVTGSAIEDSLRIEMGVVNTESFDIGEDIRINIHLPKFEDINKTDIVLFDQNKQIVKDVKMDLKSKILEFTPKQEGNYTINASLLDKSDRVIRRTVKSFSVNNPKEKKHIYIDEVIKSKNQNVLYLGIRNTIELNHPAFAFQEMMLKSNNGTLEKKKNKYVYIPESAGHVRLILYAKDVKLLSKDFVIKILPDPKVIMNNSSNNSISTKLLKIQNGLNVETNKDEFVNAYHIKGFDLIKLDYLGNKVFESKNNSAFFEGNVLSEIRKAKSSETYIFTNINVKGTDGINRQASPILLKVK